MILHPVLLTAAPHVAAHTRFLAAGSSSSGSSAGSSTGGGGGLFPNTAPTAPGGQAQAAFGTLLGDLKWVTGALAIIGVFVVAMMGVIAHRRSESVMEHFGGFLKILGLLIVVSSSVSVVTTFIS